MENIYSLDNCYCIKKDETGSLETGFNNNYNNPFIFWIYKFLRSPKNFQGNIDEYKMMIKEIENSVAITEQLINHDENEDLLVSLEMLESLILFVGNSITTGNVCSRETKCLIGLDCEDIKMIDKPGILISLNVLLSTMIKSMNRLKYPEKMMDLSDKENGGIVHQTEFEKDEILEAGKLLRIADNVARKSDNNLRCYVLSKNFMALVSNRLTSTSYENFDPSRSYIEDLELEFSSFQRSIDNVLGLFLIEKKFYSAYDIFIKFLSLIKRKFVNNVRNILRYFTFEELKALHFSDKIEISLRHLKNILKRGFVKFDKLKVTHCESDVQTVDLNEYEDIRYIMNSVQSILYCMRSVIEKTMEVISLNNLVQQTYFDIVDMMLPNWKNLEVHFTPDLSFTADDLKKELSHKY